MPLNNKQWRQVSLGAMEAGTVVGITSALLSYGFSQFTKVWPIILSDIFYYTALSGADVLILGAVFYCCSPCISNLACFKKAEANIDNEARYKTVENVGKHILEISTCGVILGGPLTFGFNWIKGFWSGAQLFLDICKWSAAVCSFTFQAGTLVNVIGKRGQEVIKLETGINRSESETILDDEMGIS